MRLIFLTLLLLSVSSPAFSQEKSRGLPGNKVEKELKLLEDEWTNSYLRGDRQAFDRIVADDFTRTDESGKSATKSEEKELVQAPPATVKVSLTNEDIQVRVYDSAAVVTGRIVSTVQDSLSFQSRFTDTFIKRGGHWQVVARHYSRIPIERKAISLDSKIYDDYAGQYEIAPDVVFTVTREGEKLVSQTPGQPKIELLPESEVEFFIKGNTAAFVFVRNRTGQVAKLIINQEGQRTNAPRVK